jgi:hypothetical protein
MAFLVKKVSSVLKNNIYPKAQTIVYENKETTRTNSGTHFCEIPADKKNVYFL